MKRSNKREKKDYKLKGGRHHSAKMWYCHLYGIIMLQHLMPRACLKIHSRHLHTPLCDIFGSHSVNVAHYANT
ncbi:hypothetical protein D3Z58_12345 [Clostridiaceae bacterium]|nr:hypothetical protein [Clostridiaceae bacterium]